MNRSAPVLSLIVLSWNTREITLSCLESIINHPPLVPWELIVIDNASEDGSPDAIEERFKGIENLKLIRNKENLGFTGGNNQGINLASGQIIGLLNSDTLVVDNSIQELFDYLVNNSEVGVVGPFLIKEDGSPTTSFGYFPTAWSILTTAFLPGYMWGNKRRALGVVPDESMKEPVEVGYVSGAAFFIKREVINEVGVFDSETFFAYFEETDWCLRIKRAGWRVMFYPGAKIIHLEGKSFEKMTAHRNLMQYESGKKFFKKHYGLAMQIWYQLCTVTGSLVKVGYFSIRMALQPSKKEKWMPHYRWNAFVFELWARGLNMKRKGAK